LYRTLPVGPVEQGDFINAVCVGQSAMGTDEILFALQKIESEMGRERLVHWGPRTMDLDLLFVGNRVIETPHLVVPHPAMHERGFVLQPLSELGLSWVHPVLGEDIGNLVARWEANHNSSESVWLLDPKPGAS
jgi:2-amino-4-hydroxy-6-hydroxymethyldihydropteridine diphosphokinase